MVSYLLGIGSNPKTIKSDKGGEYLTGILNLYPGATNVCPWATAGCIKACLHTSGNPVYQRGKDNARKERLEMFQSQRGEFLARLRWEISRLVMRAQILTEKQESEEMHGGACVDKSKPRVVVKPCVRLNGTSDITWERIDPDLFTDFPDVQFYDYTKGPHRCASSWSLPRNYDLTLSYSGQNWERCEAVLNDGGRVAMVFGGIRRKDTIEGETYRGFPMVDGDLTDLTFTRPKGVILALRAKGKAKEDQSGFVIWDLER